MTIAAKRVIGWLSGCPTTTTIPVLVTSITDAAITVHVYPTSDVSGTAPATFVINASGDSAPKLSKYADDRTQSKFLFETPTDIPDAAGETWVCWKGHTTLTGLSAGTRYWIKLTQGGTIEGTTAGDGISTCTAPATGTDFRIWGLSCDRADVSTDQDGLDAGAPYPNFYGHIKAWQAAHPSTLSFVWFVDDFGYQDGTSVQDTVKKATGVAQSHGNAYDYGIAYTHGLLGMGNDTADSPIAAGREVSRAWCLRNFNYLLMWGDHQFANQAGFNYALYNEGGEIFWNAGSTSWEELFAPLRPAISIATSSPDVGIHWGLALGDVYLVSPDGKGQMSGGGNEPYVAGVAPQMLYYYADIQIDEMLTALDAATQPFKIMGKGDGDKNMLAVPTDMYYQHQPMKEHQPTEWARLFTRTGASPKSIMDNDKTNGTTGVFVCWCGDFHRSYVCHNESASYASNAAENWDCWCSGGVNHHPALPQIAYQATAQSGATVKGTKTHYIDDSGWGEWSGAPYISGLSFDVGGSASPKKLTVTLWDAYGKAKWNAVYKVGSNVATNSRYMTVANAVSE